MSTSQRDPAKVDDVRGLIAPTVFGNLLLPAAAVAEVVSYSGGDVRPHQGGSQWLVTDLEWLGQWVPLVDLGPAAPDDIQDKPVIGTRRRRPCALVCFTPNGNPAVPYIAILTTDSPRLVRLTSADLAQAPNTRTIPLAHFTLDYRGSPAWVPDLDLIEREALLRAPSTT